jgi:membrane-bound inhibitor of C-type lysozyme
MLPPGSREALMPSRSIILCAALALAACERSAPSDGQGPLAEAGNNKGAVASEEGRPSFDCTRANGQAQQLICSDAELAAIDRELDRLDRVIGAGGPEVDARRGWTQERDGCWKADDLRQCVVEAYAKRIHELRVRHPQAPGSGGLSVGPVAFTCGGEKFAATFVNSDPGLVHLAGPNRTLTLGQARSASGARYAGRVDGEEWEFWNKGDEAVLTGPDGTAISCQAKATN